jgi:EAL domain-containing protein (putative c-di-GMP-specific phosphodiesterase class I)
VGFENETGIEIVAEGVETSLELSVLRDLGLKKVQGFFLCKPLPIASAVERTQSSRHSAKQPGAYAQ